MAFLHAAAPLGILAVPIALLMIAGEFDLSVGSVIGLSGMSIVLLTVHAGWPLWPALFVSAVIAAAIGLLNGWVVVRSEIPSFLVTLATLFIARGLSIALPRWLTGRTQLSGLDHVSGYDSAHALLASELAGLRISLLWWLLAVLIGAWVLDRTRFGNWIFATGGAPAAARALGIPTTRVRITLFVATALAAWLVAALQVVRFNGADSLRGEQMEFRAIVAVVIGGTLLTGGLGSVVGAAAGALVFGMVQQGIVLSGIDADWFQVMLGVILIVAVFINHAAQRRLMKP
jgi:simple sugar transport system permease protein